MQKDALAVALISESLNGRTRCRRAASRVLVNALRSARPDSSTDDVLRIVSEDAPEDVAQEARLLVRDLGL